MNHALNPELPFLSGGELLEAASSLDAIHGRTLKAIERLNKDVETRKASIANRWKDVHIGSMDKQRIQAEEVRVAILDIRRNAEKELDGYFRDAGAAHARAVSQRPFYDSAVKSLNRATLGDPRRSEYQKQLQGVGPAELAHLGQFAVSTGNNALAAAIVSRLDTMPAGSRPFGAATLAEAMPLDDYRKGAEAIKIADARFQAVVVAIRAWRSGRANPLSSVSLALQGRKLDESLLKQLEADDGSAG